MRPGDTRRSAAALATLAVVVAGCGGDLLDAKNAASDAALPPAGIREISLGYKDTCAVREDGRVACWGRNSSGQLGSGTEVKGAHGLPSIVARSGDALAVSIGSNHACAILASGDVDCWGDDFFGELGDGTRTSTPYPRGVAGAHGVTNLATSGAFSCAATLGGSALCWGTDFFGELGDDGTKALSPIPVPVPGLKGVVAVAAGQEHACALLASGRVQCWGANGCRQLGNATLEGQATPADVEGVADSVAVAAGLVHTCALGADGTVRCWGYDGYGALGVGSHADSARALPVLGISDATAIAAGGFDTCALHRDGAVSCWGRNDSGELGDGTTTDTSAPVRVNGISGAGQVAVGEGHACALLARSKMVCWGANDFGQLGDGTTIERHVPTEVVGLQKN